jgi:predicted nucleic acid-binding protein
VDTCVLVDIADDDPEFGAPSAECLAQHLEQGLAISAITYVELAPVFDGSSRLLDTFLSGVGIDNIEAFDARDRHAAFQAWGRHVSEKRAGQVRRRPVADALIGATAARSQGLITRNGKHFRSFFPNVPIIDPTEPKHGRTPNPLPRG